MYYIRKIGMDELPSWQRIRTNVYLELGFITPDQLNRDGLFVDGEDDRSHHLAAFDIYGQMVGTFRLIIRRPGRRLPVERQFNVRTTTKRSSAELSGLAVDARHRNGHVMLGLLRAMYDLVHEHGIHDVYAELEKPLLTQLTQLGFPFTRIGGHKLVYNTINWPVRMFVKDILPSISARDLGRSTYYAPFFTGKFDGWITPSSLIRDPGISILEA